MKTYRIQVTNVDKLHDLMVMQKRRRIYFTVNPEAGGSSITLMVVICNVITSY